MPVMLPKIDYAANDFQTFLDALQAFVQAEFDPTDFNDFVASQLIMFNLRMNAYFGDVQSYKIDVAANEGFLAVAEQRRSIIRHAKPLGYKLSAATSSSVTVTITLAAPLAQDLVIRDGTQFTAEGLVFEIDDEYTLEAGDLTINLGARQGETLVEQFVGTGEPSQKFTLSRFPAIKDTVSVTVDAVEWPAFDYIAFADPLEIAFVLSLDEDDKGTIEFGDDSFGRIPDLGSSIEVTYRIGGGAIGNLAAGSIKTNITGYLNNVTPQSVTITNGSPASGGSDPETVDHAKLFLPLFLKTINHAVTLEDYQTLASGFSDPSAGTVAKASAQLRVGELNKIDIFIWTRDNGGDLTTASLALRNSLKTYLDEKKVMSHELAVFSGLNSVTAIEATVLYFPSQIESEMEARLDEAAAEFFNSVELNPGDDVFLSRLYDHLQGVTGVHSLVLTNPAANISINPNRIATLGATTWDLSPAPLEDL